MAKKKACRFISILVLLALGHGGALSTTAQRRPSDGRDAINVRARRAQDNSGAPRTPEELRARIEEVLRQPGLAPAEVAVKVASLDTGRVLYEENANKLIRPASNLKLYTWAAALDRLTPDYHFLTSIYASARPDSTGTIKGDLTVYGRGDPSIAARFNNGDYNKAMDDLADRITAAGVRRIEGDVVGDETYLSGAPFGSGWEWEDLQWWYGAEVSALSVNDNSIDLLVKPGAEAGAQCAVSTGPPTPVVSIVNRTTTTARGTPANLSVYRALGENVIEVGGSLPVDNRGYNESVAVSHPARLFVDMLRSSLLRHGVVVAGRARAVDAHTGDFVSSPSAGLVEIASMPSPSLGVIAAQTLKPSQNLYTELMLRTLGRVAGGANSRLPSDQAGLEVVKAFLRQAGIDADSVVLTDGSGLSRRDMVTAAATLQLLTYMSRHRYANVFRDALPVAGVDGTLKNRMKKTPAAGNVHAKTGTLSSVASLSGYATSAAGERLVFSIMVNNYPEAEASEIRRSPLDAIAVLLASFAGRS
jgi:serine-type D-Ala-D-Ala carboxypeptidase/endopeptidase (penicillin-binding protein 4)